jgi:hypothetical protein
MKLAVSFELRIFLIVVLVGIISVLVILDTSETQVSFAGVQTYSQIQTTAQVMQGLQQPGEPVNTLVITGIDIGQPIGYKSPTISGNEFACFADRRVHSDAGAATARYYLRLRDPTPGGFDGCSVQYGRTETDQVGVYMQCPANQDMFSFIIELEPGLKSKIKDGELEDFLEKDIPMLGVMYTIVRAEINTATKTVSLRFMGSAGTLDLQDEYDDNEFQQNVQVNGKNIVEGRVKIIGSDDGNEFTLQSIEYRLKPLSVLGKDIYVFDHHGTKQYLQNPAGFLGDFDILFRGLAGNAPKVSVAPAKTGTSDLQTSNVIAFKSAGGVKYNMQFTNNKGKYYNFPIVYDTGSGLIWGDNTKNFWFTGGPIMEHDIFAVSNNNNKRSVTNIVEYETSNTDENKAYFKDLAGRETTAPFDPATGAGSVTLGGTNYNFVVNTAVQGNPLMIDFDGNGAIGGQANIVTSGGIQVILNPAMFTGQVYVESSLFAEGGGPEATGFAFTPGINVDITSGPQMLYNDATDNNEGLTQFGIFIQQSTKKDTGRNLIFNLPGSQVGARVFVSATQPSIGGQAQGEVLVTCERSNFVKAQMAAQAANQ